MDERALDTVAYLVRRYRLHDRLPVDISPLLENFTVRDYNLTYRTLGFSIVMRNEVHIGVNKHLNAAQRRLTLAHESGHIISFHPDMNYTCELNTWFKSKLEHEAQIIASYLLVPQRAACVYGDRLSAYEIATRLDVPVSLVDLRWSQGKIWGEF